jgi:hypothetical protein
LDYALSRFERYLYEGYSEEQLVENHLRAISAFRQDPVVGASSDDVAAKLNENPVNRVGGLALMGQEESKYPVMKTDAKDEKKAISQEAIAKTEVTTTENSEYHSQDESRELEITESSTLVERETEERRGAVTERTTITTKGSEDPSSESANPNLNKDERLWSVKPRKEEAL